MAVVYRKYNAINDYKKVCTFLENSYEFYGTRFDNNLTLFEFQCALSLGLEEKAKSIDEVLDKVFLWFDEDQLVGLLEKDAFCLAQNYRFLFDEVVKVGEENYSNAENLMEWEVYEKDSDYENTLLNRGYSRSDEYWVRRDFELYQTQVPDNELPEGFKIESVPNLKEFDEVYMAYKLCYGILFNKKILQNLIETSTYRKELDLVAVGPDTNVVALCSGRYEEANKLVTIEAVSCYHDYRERGISKALLIHQLKAAKELGANKVTVYTAMPEKYPAPNKHYESVGFKLVGRKYVWRKVHII